MADEHPGLRQLPLTGWIRDHRGTIPRPYVPGHEVEAVAGSDCQLLVGAPELGGRDIRTRTMGSKNRDRDRDDEPVSGQRDRNHDAGSTDVAEPARFARAPEKNGRAPDEHDAGRAEEEPRPVLAPGANSPGIRDG